MTRKIIVFDERISSLDEDIWEVTPKKNICDFCGQYRETKYKIHNLAFINLLDLCDKCAILYYGGITPISGILNVEASKIPIDPLLDYLNKIDPIPK